MISPAALRAPRATLMAQPADARDRWARRRVALAWGLLVLNVLVFYPKTWLGLPLVVPIPSIVGKMITQGALPAAFLAALSANRRVLVRPSVFLCLVGLLAIEALMTCLQAHYIGTVYRSLRLTGFVATLWLLTPWWSRRDLLLVRCQLGANFAVLGLMLAGVLIDPGAALAQGRLAGVLWPTPPTQVAEFAAVTTGLVIVLWLAGQLSGRRTLAISAGTITILLLTHTRTALVAMIGGIVVAGLSLVVARPRVRRLFTAVGIVVAIGAITMSGVVAAWITRGQNAQQLSDLTGRTTVWDGVLADPRSPFQMIFGFGLSNKSFNGLPIDSNWLASYLDQGLFGVAVSVAVLIFLLVAAFFAPRGVRRALALFLVTYCLAASVTETGFSDASTYLLYLALAASLLVPAAAESPG